MDPRRASADKPAEVPRRGRLLVGAVGLVVVVGVLAFWRYWPRPAASADRLAASVPGDPRLTFATPYRNVRPDVAYVGDAACSPCHAGQANTYRNHPMGRSLAPVATAVPVERYDPAAKDPFDALGFRYRVERAAGRVVHRETATDAAGRALTEAEAEVRYAVGSGARGRSYLIERDGFLFESPITWYVTKGAWDLSPGYEQHNHHFGRPVPADCLFCHSNRALPVPDTENRYRPPVFEGHAIGCERCHGPGDLHVRRQQAGEAYAGGDATIVNPGRLEPGLRDAVCEQCHLGGTVRVLRRGREPFDYRPGLPLQLFLAVFVKASAGGTDKFVGQVEQMHTSRCYQAGNGRLGCISCHDPHALPPAGRRVAYYRDRCLRCHADRGCTVPAEARRKTSADDNCRQCHMPAGPSDIRHESITNHRIPRRAEEVSPAPSAAPPADALPLRAFHGQADDRDLGLALVDRIERYPGPVRRRLGELALRRLEPAVAADPGDVAAQDARAHALWAVGDTPEAARAFDKVLEQSPGREFTLQGAAVLAMERGRPAEAVRYWERAGAANPWRAEFRQGLAAARADAGDWPAALEACQEALRLNPANLGTRKLLVRCLLETGDAARARAEFDRLLGLHPPDEDALRRWFESRSR